MAVEVFRGSIDGISGDSDDYEKEMFELAGFFSNSAHFNIIDSYSSIGGVGRYKGDPIADLEWTSIADVGDDNDWFVIECQTENPALAAMGYSGLANWQLKFQWTASDFYDVTDPTGVKYPKNHEKNQISCMRFAPWGGWDLDDVNPDFDPVSGPAGGVPSSGNHRHNLGGADANDRTQFLICSDGWFARICTTSAGGKGVFAVAAIVGDVIPRTTIQMPNPRALFGNGTGTSAPTLQEFLAEDGNWTNGTNDYAIDDGAGGGVVFWDENEVLVESKYTTQRKSALRYAQANMSAANLDNDTHPIIVFPYKKRPGFIFEFSYMRKAFCSALQARGNKQWFAADWGWAPIFPWDGSTDPYAGY